MNSVVIYGSVYGTSKEYAEELSKRLGVSCEDYKTVKNPNIYEEIFYVGGLYAGGVCGMAKLLKKWDFTEEKKLHIVTVGLSDPEDPNNRKNILAGIEKQLSPDMFSRADIYHLRGGIDYGKLSLGHKTMMKMLNTKASKVPEEERDADTRAFLETYGKKVSFVDFSSLNKLNIE
ncbi:MAG: flavodoxin domain-containing protein [Eubacteriaceae bacterium]|nr:flavodoxin domain-containing protein [Eubacteriaceae bacterium]